MAETQNKLPISVDVSVSLSKAQVAVGTDMTIMCLCTPNVDFLHGNRVSLYSTADSFNKICTAGDTVWWAGNAFFSKTKRPGRIAVARVFETNQAAYLLSGGTNVESLTAVTSGAMNITIDGTPEVVSSLDFSSATSIDDVAAEINTALGAVGTCEVYHGNLLIKSATTGAGSTISFASAPSSGTDVSALLGLTEATGASLADGYVAGSMADELQAIADAATKAGYFFYGWVFDSEYRDTADQLEAAQWVNGRSFRAIGAYCTNNPNAYDPASTSNNGYKAMNIGYNTACFVYDDNAQVYPEISYLANFLAVNYSEEDSTIAGKFKDADGIAAVNFPNIESNVETLKARRINTITGIIGQTLKYFREGEQSGSAWSTDGWVNVCNFIAELEIEILNVFLRNKKVTYTINGQNLLIAAASKICNKYEKNGSFADRIVEDKSTESGYTVIPACQIDIQELSATTAAQRAAHIGTPITITVQDAGWMGSIAINVEVEG